MSLEKQTPSLYFCHLRLKTREIFNVNVRCQRTKVRPLLKYFSLQEIPRLAAVLLGGARARSAAPPATARCMELARSVRDTAARDEVTRVTRVTIVTLHTAAARLGTVTEAWTRDTRHVTRGDQYDSGQWCGRCRGDR